MDPKPENGNWIGWVDYLVIIVLAVVGVGSNDAEFWPNEIIPGLVTLAVLSLYLLHINSRQHRAAGKSTLGSYGIAFQEAVFSKDILWIGLVLFYVVLGVFGLTGLSPATMVAILIFAWLLR